VTNATASVTEEDKLWSKYDWSVESKIDATLRYNIARALKLSHSRYTKLKRITQQQQDEKDTIELGMLSIMQMHSNETGTEAATNWKDTFTDIHTLYLKEYQTSTQCEMIQTEQENKETTEDIETNDSDEDSDEDDSDYVETNQHRKINYLFGDEEDSDDSGMEDTLGKISGNENILGNGSQDAVATDNERTESGKAATNDVSDKSDQQSEPTTTTDTENTKKRVAPEKSEVKKGKKAKTKK
jgi:hypothetical protein